LRRAHQCDYLCSLIVVSSLEIAVYLGNVVGHIEHSVGVAPLIVVPGDHLNKLGVQLDTSLGVEDGRVGRTVEVLGDNFVFSVAEDALHLALRHLLHLLADFIVRGIPVKLDSEINS
jgi:hypothetical protein